MSDLQAVFVAARRKLLADSGFAALLGTDVGRDIPGPFSDGWVFKASDDMSVPEREVRNTGTSAVVISLREPWSGPNLTNTLEFRTLRFTLWSDGTRGSDTALAGMKDAEFRCDRVARSIKKVFNDVANADHFWPNDVYVVSCTLWNDLKITDVSNEDGLVVGDLSFALHLG